MPPALASLCVFCGSRHGNDPAYAESARAVGRALAERNIRLVYGGGSVGLMGEVADACLAGGGEVAGVITSYLEGRELGHKGIQQLEVVSTMAERKERMAELSDAFLSLPGGIGTLDELFEMLTWSQLRVHAKPNGLLNVNGFYDSLLDFFGGTQAEAGFLGTGTAAKLHVSDDVDEILEKLSASMAEHAHDLPD